MSKQSDLRQYRSYLAPREYYQELIDEMKQHGFELMGWVTTNSLRFAHIFPSYPYSQDARLFFFYPEKAFIVMLSHDENVGGKSPSSFHYNSHWHAGLWLSYMREELLPSGLIPEAFFDDGTPVYDWIKSIVCGNESRFTCLSGSDGNFGGTPQLMQQLETSSQHDVHLRIPVTELVQPFRVLAAAIGPYLFPRFGTFLAIGFESPYFRNANQAFWHSFPINRFQEVADKVLGITL